LLAVQHLAGGAEGPVETPWRFDAVTKDNRLDVHLPVGWFTPRRWRIVPDDLLTNVRVDGKAVPLDRVPPGGLRDFAHGFEFDLSSWLRPGDNEIEFTVTNSGGPGGLAFYPVVGWQIALVFFGTLPWLFALASAFRLRRAHVAILCGAVLVLCFYWAATPWFARTYDVKRLGEGGHLDYVAYVAEHAALPRPDAGWEYYHPPLYYALGALVWRGASRIGASPTDALQAYSLFLWIVFLVAGTATFERALPRKGAGALVATAGLALWPSGVMDSQRIGNDAALYAAAGVATWFLVRWWRSRRRRHLIGASAFVGLAFLAKGNAVALLAALLALLLLAVMRRGRWRRPRVWLDVLASAAAVATGVFVSVARNLWYWHRGQVSTWLVSNVATLDASLRVPNRIRDYIPLDIPTFLDTPWISTRDDATGRANFWNFMLRSSLTGEFSFDGTFHRYVAVAWGVALLAMVALLVLSLSRTRPSIKALWPHAPLILLGVAWLGSLVCSRIVYPFSCGGDFRYIVPVLIPLMVWCGSRGVLTKLLLCFIALGSTAFFVSV
jgi:hypothetical protein